MTVLETVQAAEVAIRQTPATARNLRVLVVDLNKMTTFPTLAVGILVSALRARGHGVDVICPLALGVPAAERERQETLYDHVHRRIRLSDFPAVTALRDAVRAPREWLEHRPRPVVLHEVDAALDEADIVLLSAYLDHFPVVKAIGEKAHIRGTPVLLGGPMFNLGEVASAWRSLKGITAVVGAEIDRDLPDLVQAAVAGEPLTVFPGVTLPDGTRGKPAGPLRNLDATPIPDYGDFPWDRYPVRIVPVMTGRGCQWDKCTFCSDVISASGRTFRTRSLENVLIELQTQAERHNAKDFIFLDLKLNSFPGMFRGLARELRTRVRGAEWIGTVHVDGRKDNGLSRRDLFDAASGGMRRISFGLESGSQRLLDAMDKGCTVERNAEFLKNAHEAGLSVRCTMFKGYPGETAEDMEATADFLEANAEFIDRIRFNAFMVPIGTPIEQALLEKAEGRLHLTGTDDRRARALYGSRGPGRAYRRAKARALDVVYQINRKPLRENARQFDGTM
ncbi:MAG: radical SAM protein [Pseudomonadota bacterium]